MAKIQELLEGKNAKIDYKEILDKYPWIAEQKRYCVLSPDSDGLLCGLFMAKVLKWKIVGFYDDKVCVINKDYLKEDIVFLDGEIFRREIKSFGHHMVKYNRKQDKEIDWSGFNCCIQPNLIRNYDGKNEFRLKYPLASIHMLVSMVAFKKHQEGKKLKIPVSAIPPLFFTDGVFQNLFSYPENVLNWLSYLRIDESWNPLRDIFQNDTYSVYTLMNAMDGFFRMRDSITRHKERGDRLKLSEKDGEKYNIENQGRFFSINKDAVARIEKFMTQIGQMTAWEYNKKDWLCWEQLKFFKFTKKDFNGEKRRINNKTFLDFIKRNPLSWAMTSGQNIEYTLEEPDKLYISGRSAKK